MPKSHDHQVSTLEMADNLTDAGGFYHLAATASVLGLASRS